MKLAIDKQNTCIVKFFNMKNTKLALSIYLSIWTIELLASERPIGFNYTILIQPDASRRNKISSDIIRARSLRDITLMRNV